RYRRPFASTWMRAGSLNQSEATLSFGRDCLMTHDSPLDRVSDRVLLDTPPLNVRIVGLSETPIRPVLRSYLSSCPLSSMSIMGRWKAFTSGEIRETFEVFKAGAGIENDDRFVGSNPARFRKFPGCGAASRTLRGDKQTFCRTNAF